MTLRHAFPAGSSALLLLFPPPSRGELSHSSLLPLPGGIKAGVGIAVVGLPTRNGTASVRSQAHSSAAVHSSFPRRCGSPDPQWRRQDHHVILNTARFSFQLSDFCFSCARASRISIPRRYEKNFRLPLDFFAALCYTRKTLKTEKPLSHDPALLHEPFAARDAAKSRAGVFLWRWEFFRVISRPSSTSNWNDPPPESGRWAFFRARYLRTCSGCTKNL